MKMYSVLMLPLVAVVMIIFLPLFGGDKNISRRFRSRKRRKIWLGRLTVFMLFLSTAITLAMPIYRMSSLLQGLLITAAVMIPAALAHLLASHRHGHSFNVLPRWLSKDDTENQWFDSDADKSQHQPVVVTPSTIPPVSENSTQAEVETISPGQDREEISRSHLLSSDEISSARATSEVEEQLSRISKYVQSHDIGGEIHVDNESMTPVVDKPVTGLSLSALNESLDTSDSTALSSMSVQQLSSLVMSLIEEKGKLQKLVISQHAVIASEREANVRNRGMARDAIKLMNGARKNQKMAEKMARRERTERQRLELEYKKVSVALNNAMSIISSGENSSNPVGDH